MAPNFERLISAGSHVMEPPDLWSKAIGDRYGDRAPHLMDSYLGWKGQFFFTGRQVLKFGQSDQEAPKLGLQEAG